MLRLIKKANSDSESSFYDEATDYQLEDDGNDDRVLAQLGIGTSHGEPQLMIRMPKIKNMLRPMTPMDCYQSLLRLDLRGKSKFGNGEYQYLLRIAAHSLSNFVNSHLGPISKRVKTLQCVG